MSFEQVPLVQKQWCKIMRVRDPDLYVSTVVYLLVCWSCEGRATCSGLLLLCSPMTNQTTLHLCRCKCVQTAYKNLIRDLDTEGLSSYCTDICSLAVWNHPEHSQGVEFRSGR